MKKLFILLLFISITGFSSTISAQNAPTNAEYVSKLIKSTAPAEVFVVALNDYKKYNKAWLDNVTFDGEFLIFRKGNDTQSWNIKSVVFIDQYGSVIKVKLSEKMGL